MKRIGFLIVVLMLGATGPAAERAVTREVYVLKSSGVCAGAYLTDCPTIWGRRFSKQSCPMTDRWLSAMAAK